ncbi:MAG: RNA polymerase factor sigma-54 [Candidatus Omnitrophota bacterium]|nr:RNA polymerase factor sigma-54 [Candidatus Omnitrophota bacterium]
MEKISLSHRLSPKLLITPKLKQALYILQLPYNSLEGYLKEQIAENPLLQSMSKENLEGEIKKILSSNNASYLKNQTYSGSEIDNSMQFSQKEPPQTQNLQDYLLQQLRMTFLNENELLIAEELINHIDSNGYLRVSLEQFSKERDLPLEKIEAVLRAIQSLEPSGIGARNLQECLLIQLKNDEQEQSLAYKIVQSHFKELTKKAYQIIAKKLDVSIAEVKSAIEKIKSLNPRPGTTISQEENNVTIIPDVFVKVYSNKLRLMFNDDNLPQLKVNPFYKKLLKSSAASEETTRFIKERLKSALWLIEAVKQRQNNMIKVIKAIAEIQKQAMRKDLSYLKPLGLKDIAHKTGLHLSTVARIASNKYIATPQGTLRIKDLFSPKLTLNKGGSISRKNVLSRIKNIVCIDKQKPLFDQAIADILRKNGINISRRTVTKYRNLLKIPPVFLR